MSIYLACAGDSNINGVYEKTSSSPIAYTNREDTSLKITFNGSTGWVLADNVDQYYFLSGSPTTTNYEIASATGWTLLGVGTSPAPKSYLYDSSNSLFNTVIVGGAGTSAVNGTYTWTTSITVNLATGTSYTVSGYLHSGGSYIISVRGGVWTISSVANMEEIYTSNFDGNGPPEGLFVIDPLSSTGAIDPPECYVYTTSFCSSDYSDYPEGGQTPTNCFIYRNNNNNYILKNGNNFYIRKTL